MHAAADHNAFDWIANGRAEIERNVFEPWNGALIRNILPPMFPHYTKILHQFEADYDYFDNPLDSKEEIILGFPKCNELRQYLQHHRIQGAKSRIRWSEMAAVLGVPYVSDITHAWFRSRLEPGCWPRYIRGPDDGALQDFEIDEVVRILQGYTGNQACYFRFSEIYFLPPPERPVLYRGNLHELPHFLKEGKFQFTPEYWWPADHRWCVCTDYDLTFTFVGGSPELSDELAASPILECLSAKLDTRIDDDATEPS
jgi:hypothetical protein